MLRRHKIDPTGDDGSTWSSNGMVFAVEETIREVLAEYAKLMVDASTIEVDDDLYTLGLTSHASVNVMLGLEDAFDVEFPDAALRKETFRSISSIREALSQVGVSTKV